MKALGLLMFVGFLGVGGCQFQSPPKSQPGINVAGSRRVLDAMSNPLADFKHRWPKSGLSDQQILQNLHDPAKFRTAFPDYSGVTDSEVRARMSKFDFVKPGLGSILSKLEPTIIKSQDPRIVLDPLKVDKSVKRDAWDAYQAAQNPEDFRARFDKLSLPREAQDALRKMKFGSSIYEESLNAFFEATDEKDMRKRLNNADVPSEIKADLLALRFGDICEAMEVVPADYVPEPEDFDAYYSAVGECWNEGNDAHDAAAQVAAAKRLFTLNSAQMANLRKQLESVKTELTVSNHKLTDTQEAANIADEFLIGGVKAEIKNKDAISSLQSRLAVLSIQYTNLRSQYDNLQSQHDVLQSRYNLLLSQRQQRVPPRGVDCEPNADGSFDCIPFPVPY